MSKKKITGITTAGLVTLALLGGDNPENLEMTKTEIPESPKIEKVDGIIKEQIQEIEGSEKKVEIKEESEEVKVKKEIKKPKKIEEIGQIEEVKKVVIKKIKEVEVKDITTETKTIVPTVKQKTTTNKAVDIPVVSTVTTTEETVKEKLKKKVKKETLKDRNAPYYTSSHSRAKYYYPAKCQGWKGLTPKYLKKFYSLSELKSKYNRTLNPNC